jgi:RNA polymerase sigma factor (sigma-70 family)
MSPVTTSSVALQIESLFDGASVVGLTDRQLIERFTARRDATGEAAFAALVSRHGPMVMDICRQVLRTPHDAEDAFQAVFLILACRARSIRNPDLLGSWLYAVARRTARKARVQIARRRQNDEAAMMRLSGSGSAVIINNSIATPEQGAVGREQADALYSEIDRLPGPFRRTIVLYFFEGLTLEETARQLRCPAGTVRSRLARACEKLRRGLTRRGFALSTAAIASALTTRSASACVSSAVCEATSRAAVRFVTKQAAAGVLSASAVALASDVLRSLLIAKLRIAALTCLVLGAVIAGAVFLGEATGRQAGKPDLLRSAAKVDDEAKPKPGRMFVIGRVLDPQGKPVPNASVMVYARSLAIRLDVPTDRLNAKELGHASSDTLGRIRVDVPRTSSAGYDEFGVVALAPGYGAGWADLDADADQPTADIALRPEQVIQGRLFDLQGEPARDVKLSVTAIQRVAPKSPNPVPDNLEGPAFLWTHPDDLPGWPGPVMTGADGRFTLHGVGPGLRVSLSVLDPRFASPLIDINTDAALTRKPLTFALQPARTLTGRITYADTGKPAPNAQLMVFAFDQQTEVRPRPILAAANADGRFRVNPGFGDQFTLSARPPDGKPYLVEVQRIQWPKGAVAHSAELALPRGLILRGKVTEHGSGRPVAGAAVTFLPVRAPNGEISRRQSQPVETTDDGSFAFTALPRLGYVIVRGPHDDYVLQEVDHGLLFNGQPGNWRVYAHAFVACDPKSDGAGHDVHNVNVVLRPGITVKGLVVGPDGQPVPDAWMISRIHRYPGPMLYARWSAEYHSSARNGQFELHGLDPDADVPISFLEPRRKLGANVRFSGKRAEGEPIVVKLEPCGAATARVVGPESKPLRSMTPPMAINMVVTPGEVSQKNARMQGTFIADAGALTSVDPVNYPKPPASDDQGRVVLPALVPGTTYQIVDRTTGPTPAGPKLRKEFTVKPGETLDLGDILIEKPGS